MIYDHLNAITRLMSDAIDAGLPEPHSVTATEYDITAHMWPGDIDAWSTWLDAPIATSTHDGRAHYVIDTLTQGVKTQVRTSEEIGGVAA